VQQPSYGGLDDRKTLGPIGTERATRRPAANIAPSMYAADVNMAAGPLHDSWNIYTDGGRFQRLCTVAVSCLLVHSVYCSTSCLLLLLLFVHITGKIIRTSIFVTYAQL